MHPEQTEEIQWGVLIVLPNGVSDVERQHGRGGALSAAEAANRLFGNDQAKVVYRTVKYGPWETNTDGNEWGVRIAWPDGHVELRREACRSNAEARVRLHTHPGRRSVDPSTIVVVSRQAEHGDWWLVGGAA